MENINLIKHEHGAFLLRFLGLGPKLRPLNAIHQLQELLENNTFWAKGRSKKQLKTMIAHSDSVVTLWHGKRMIGFGRATTDKAFRAVLWDIVIAADHQNHGLGTMLVKEILESENIKNVQKVYLMTTNCKDFYESCGFTENQNQTVLIHKNNKFK